MKSIQLHTATVDNGGVRRDAGDVIAIGKRPDEIALERAKELVGSQMAAEFKGEDPEKGSK